MIGEIDKNPRVVTGRIQMHMPDKLLGCEMKVLVNERQQSASGKQNKKPFCCFKNGYNTKTAF